MPNRPRVSKRMNTAGTLYLIRAATIKLDKLTAGKRGIKTTCGVLILACTHKVIKTLPSLWLYIQVKRIANAITKIRIIEQFCKNVIIVVPDQPL